MAVFACPIRAVKWNVLPSPGALSTQIWPSIICTSRKEMVSPRPVPSYFRVIELSACVKASKIASCFSGAMPIPVSRTVKCSKMLSLSAGLDGNSQPPPRPVP